MTRFLLFSTSIALLLFLAGACIPVEDLGESWDKGTVDPKLEGHWKKAGVEFRSEDEYISFIKAEDHYLVEQIGADSPDGDRTLRYPAKTLEWGKHKYLMCLNTDKAFQKPQPAHVEGGADQPRAKKPGGLQRYSVADDALSLFFLDDSVLWEAVEQNRVKGKIAENSLPPVWLSVLDEETMRFITTLADDADNWERVDRYVRIENRDEALKVSRSYPATDETPANTLVTIKLPDLKYFAEGRTDLLLRHLEASPEWKVSRERGAIICERRRKEEGKWRAGMNEFEEVSETQWVQTRSEFRFSRKSNGEFAQGKSQPFFVQAGPLEGEIHLRLRSSDQGIESYLAVGQPGLWFEFFEMNYEEERTRTRQALKWLEQFTKDLRAAEAEIEAKGYASALMPPDAIHKGEPTLEVEDGLQRGIYEVFAWINPGEEGEVYLKVVQVGTGAALSKDTIKLRSREYIGWSKDPDELFLHNSEITVFEGDWNHAYVARFELWFDPKKPGPDRKLIETTRSIFGWQR